MGSPDATLSAQRGPRTGARRLTDPVAMATLRARLSGSLMLVAGLSVVLTVATLPSINALHRWTATAIAGVIPCMAIIILIAGRRLNDLMFVLSQCLVELLLVPVTYLAEKPTTMPGNDTGLIVPILVSAVFAGKRRHIALQIAVTIASSALTTVHRLGPEQLRVVLPSETVTFSACAIVVRILQELARSGMQQAEAAVQLAEAATRRAELGEITDPLTGLLNRRGFERTGSSEWSRRAQEQLPLAVLLIDVDHFKKVNDTLGHAGGDALLINLAARLTKLLREGDHAYRIGGEEFAVLAHCRPGEAAVIAERVREVVEAELSVTVSIGVLEAAPQDDADIIATLWGAIDRADQGLYDAKRGGRNKVVAVSPS